MEVGVIVIILIVVLFGLLACGMWIGIALAITGTLALTIATGYAPGPILAQIAYNCLNSWVLTAVPLFIFMGEILLRTGLSHQLFDGLTPWVSRIPGRLLHINVFGSAIFAAISGSACATTATIGNVTFPEFKKRKYDIKLPVGSLAGAGTLGLLIPPSTSLIVYGALTNVSVGQLFVAGFLPGFLVAGLFSLYIAVRAIREPSLTPTTESYSWKDTLRATPKVIPIFLLIVVVLGTIYMGIATPTEAGAIGVAGAVIVSMIHRTFTWKAIGGCAIAAIITSSMIMFILVGASFMASATAYLRIPAILAETVASWGTSPYVVLALCGLIYLVLGCFFDDTSMMVMTLPIVFPLLIKELGFDPVWFGIFLVILIQVGNITPPVGFNLYVIEALTGLDVRQVVRYTIPFFFLLLLGDVIIAIWPQIALFLPGTMKG